MRSDRDREARDGIGEKHGHPFTGAAVSRARKAMALPLATIKVTAASVAESVTSRCAVVVQPDTGRLAKRSIGQPRNCLNKRFLIEAEGEGYEPSSDPEARNGFRGCYETCHCRDYPVVRQ